jgi:hypothetical protein
MKLFKPFKIVLTLAVMFVCLAVMGCETEPVKIIAEADETCHFANVECGAGLACVSHYDGGQMLCKMPCQQNTDCPGTEVCEAAPQISESALASAPLVCQPSCSSLPGSGCGGEIDAPGTIVKWEVLETGDLYQLRGINAAGETYLDATMEWYGDETLALLFNQPHSCEITMSIAEATVYTNTCDEEAAAAIGSVGLDLFTDMETVLTDAKKDGSSNWISKGCPWVVGGMGLISAGYFSAGALYGAAFAAASGAGVIAPAALTGAIIAIPAVAVLGVTAGGCWLNGKLQDPPLSECIADCSYGNTPCFDQCIDNELKEDNLAVSVLLPQCVFACEQDDEICLDSCSFLML